MQRYKKNTESQRGMVSLLTVIFFTVLTLVVTLGFVRLMLVEQRQATDDNLSNMAKAAAESGIEDAKRAILKYESLADGPAKTLYWDTLNDPECNKLNKTSTIATELGLDPQGDVGEGQRYSCLTVKLKTNEFKGPAQKESQVIPLRSTGPFNQVNISWHLISNDLNDGDGVPTAYWPYNTLPSSSEWNGPAGTLRPAFLRVQLFGYPDGGASRANLNSSNRSVTLIPSNGGSASNTLVITSEDPKSGWSTPSTASVKEGVKQVICSNGGIGRYACSTTIDFGSLPTAGHNYFLRVTPLYAGNGSHYEVRLRNSGTPVQFNGVQPIIDVTGQVTDVYRRLEARVMFDSFMTPPENAIETTEDLCKTMRIAQPADYLPNGCS